MTTSADMVLPEVESVWRDPKRPVRSYRVLQHLDPVVLPSGRELPREVLCERSDHTGKREVHKRVREFHAFDGGLVPLNPPALADDDVDLTEAS